jgi:branched-chain amino acid transport system ATP-binding protein
MDAHEKLGTTLVLIEHDLGVVMDLSDHVIVLDYGRKIADGSPEAVRADVAVVRAYVGSFET